MTLDDVKAIAEIAVLVIGLPAAFWRGWRSWDKRLSCLESDVRLVNERTKRIENQFGDNGGGLREAVNIQGKLLEKIDERTIETKEDLGILTGRVNQMVGA